MEKLEETCQSMSSLDDSEVQCLELFAVLMNEWNLNEY